MPNRFLPPAWFACSCASPLLFLLAAAQAVAGDKVDLTPRAHDAEPYAVSVQFELGGKVQVPASQESSDDKPVAKPVRVVAELSYDEVRPKAATARSIRHYNNVDVQLTIAGQTTEPELRDSRRLVVAHLTDEGLLQIVAPEGPLLRSEFDAIDVVADSHVLGQLLPERPLEIGDSWKHNEQSIRLLVGLDRITVCEVSSALMEANDRYARCEIAGAAHGTTHGADREVELRGVYLYDRQLARICQLNLAVREKRAIGPATRGLDATAKLRVKLSPVGEDTPLTSAVIASASSLDLDQQAVIQTSDRRLGFRTQHDVSWFPLSKLGDRMAIRRVGTDGLIAHANLSKLPSKRIDSGEALAKFSADFVAALGKDVTGLVSDEQWINRHGCRVISVVAEGAVGGVPMQWHGYQVAPPVESEDMHRLALTVAVEKSQLERLGAAGREFVDQLELVEQSTLEARQSRPTSVR